MERVREEAASSGLRTVVVWAERSLEEQEAEAVATSSPSAADRLVQLHISQSQLVQSLRERLPHLVILDALGIVQSAEVETTAAQLPSLQASPRVSNAARALFLLSSGSPIVGGSSSPTVRLLSLLRSRRSAGAGSAATSSVLHPSLSDLELDVFSFGCWESSLHALRNESCRAACLGRPSTRRSNGCSSRSLCTQPPRYYLRLLLCALRSCC